MSVDSPILPGSDESIEPWQATLLRLKEIRQLEQRVADLKRELVINVQAAATPSLDHATPLLLVRIGRRLAALPMGRVEEVVRMVALTPTDAEIKGVIGLADYHGRLVAVIDPRVLFGETAAAIRPSQAVVFCQAAPLLIGLRVDEVVDVTQVLAEDLSTTEEVLPGSLRSAGVARTAEGVALVLEPVLLAVAAELMNLPDQAPTKGAGESP